MKHSPMLAVVLCMLFAVPGCNKPTPDEVQQLTGAAITLGFGAWAKSNPDQEAKISAQIAQGATNALAYLKGAQGEASTVLQAAIQAKLTEGLPPDIQALVKSAASIVDQVLPEPSPTTFLTPDQLAYMTASIQGIKDGCGSKAVVSKDMVEKVKKLLARAPKDRKWFK